MRLKRKGCCVGRELSIFNNGRLMNHDGMCKLDFDETDKHTLLKMNMNMLHTSNWL